MDSTSCLSNVRKATFTSNFVNSRFSEKQIIFDGAHECSCLGWRTKNHFLFVSTENPSYFWWDATHIWQESHGFKGFFIFFCILSGLFQLHLQCLLYLLWRVCIFKHTLHVGKFILQTAFVRKLCEHSLGRMVAAICMKIQIRVMSASEELHVRKCDPLCAKPECLRMERIPHFRFPFWTLLDNGWSSDLLKSLASYLLHGTIL